MRRFNLYIFIALFFIFISCGKKGSLEYPVDEVSLNYAINKII